MTVSFSKLSNVVHNCKHLEKICFKNIELKPNYVWHLLAPLTYPTSKPHPQNGSNQKL